MVALSGGVATFVTHSRSRSKKPTHETDVVPWDLPQIFEHASTQTAAVSHQLVSGLLRRLRWLFDFVGCRSVPLVSSQSFGIVMVQRTEDPLYSSNSLSSSSISVYATLMWETGRSRDERAVKAEEKNDCVFAL